VPTWARLPTGDSSAGVYGTLLTLSVLVGLSIDKAGAGAMVATVAVTAAVFWLAHVHAGVVAGWVRSDARPGRAAIAEAMRGESPMLESAIPVLALLVLAWIGVLGLSLAVWASLGYGVAALFVWGVLIARRAELGVVGVLVVAGVNLGLGCLIVLLKLLVH
jgi:hypothetical protein